MTGHRPPTVAPAAAPARAPLILLAKSEVLWRHRVAEALRAEGYRIVEASHGEEAQTLLRLGLDPDLLICDLKLPGRVDGEALSLLCRTFSPRVPVLLAAAECPAELAGAVVFLPKPYSFEGLVSAVAGLVSGGMEEVTRKQAILVVDSEVIVRHAISDYLRECGYDVIEAASTDEATTVLGDASLEVDAVMCDVAAAGTRNGFELSLWMKKERPGLELILSGSIPAAAGAAARLCEQGPHVARPYDPQAVVDYVRRLFAQRDRAGD